MGKGKPGYNPKPYRGRPVKKGKAAKKGQNTGMCRLGRAVGTVVLGLLAVAFASIAVQVVW